MDNFIKELINIFIEQELVKILYKYFDKYYIDCTDNNMQLVSLYDYKSININFDKDIHNDCIILYYSTIFIYDGDGVLSMLFDNMTLSNFRDIYKTDSDIHDLMIFKNYLIIHQKNKLIIYDIDTYGLVKIIEDKIYMFEVCGNKFIYSRGDDQLVYAYNDFNSDPEIMSGISLYRLNNCGDKFVECDIIRDLNLKKMYTLNIKCDFEQSYMIESKFIYKYYDSDTNKGVLCMFDIISLKTNEVEINYYIDDIYVDVDKKIIVLACCNHVFVIDINLIILNELNLEKRIWKEINKIMINDYNVIIEHEHGVILWNYMTNRDIDFDGTLGIVI